MKTKLVDAKTAINKIWLNKDNTNSYLGAIASKWIFNKKCQTELKKLHDIVKWYMNNKKEMPNAHWIYEIVDGEPILKASGRTQIHADSYLNDDRVLIIFEQ